MARTITATVDLKRHALSLVDVGALVPGTQYNFLVQGLPSGLGGLAVKLYGHEGREVASSGSDSDSDWVVPATAQLSPVTGHQRLYYGGPVTSPEWEKGMTSVLCRLEDSEGDVYVSCRVPVTPVPESWK